MNETTTAQGPCVDHLVVFATDLAGGVDWCQRTLGITPTAGGEHPLMGTHNRIFNISSPGHPRAYLEIIAINSVAASALPAGARRWFDMDDATLQQQVAQHGPQLIHWVACVPEVAASHAALAAQDIERGAIITASRPTPNGLLQWQITVREDGLRLLDGCLPTLIQWGAVHPCDSLPPMVALTANATGDRQYYRDHGMQDVINKPLGSRAVREVIGHLFADLADDEADEQADAGNQDALLDLPFLTDYASTVGKPVLLSSVDLFEKMMPDYMAVLDSNMIAKDQAGVVEEAHKIKGAAGSIGLRRLQHISRLNASNGVLDAISIAPDRDAILALWAAVFPPCVLMDKFLALAHTPPGTCRR